MEEGGKKARGWFVDKLIYESVVYDPAEIEESKKVIERDRGPEWVASETPGPTHAEVYSLRLPGVLLDEKIATIIDLLTDCGVRTRYSCQGGPSKDEWRPDYSTEQAYIMFETDNDLMRATNLLSELAFSYNRYSLGARILGGTALAPNGIRAINEDSVLESWSYRIMRDWDAYDAGSDGMCTLTRFDHEDVLRLDKLIRWGARPDNYPTALTVD